jgi:hypothetical protein
MLRSPPFRQRPGRRSSNIFKINRTTIFVLAIICGEIIRYFLFSFLLRWDSKFLQRPIFPFANTRRSVPHPCGAEGSESSSDVICPPQQVLNYSTKNTTRRSFQIHVFLYRRVDSAALLLRDLTDAEYKVRCTSLQKRPCALQRQAQNMRSLTDGFQLARLDTAKHCDLTDLSPALHTSIAPATMLKGCGQFTAAGGFLQLRRL